MQLQFDLRFYCTQNNNTLSLINSIIKIGCIIQMKLILIFFVPTFDMKFFFR